MSCSWASFIISACIHPCSLYPINHFVGLDSTISRIPLGRTPLKSFAPLLGCLLSIVANLAFVRSFRFVPSFNSCAVKILRNTVDVESNPDGHNYASPWTRNTKSTSIAQARVTSVDMATPRYPSFFLRAKRFAEPGISGVNPLLTLWHEKASGTL